MTDLLQAVADELAIRNLTAGYTDAINRLDADEAARAYIDDGVLVMMDRPIVTGHAGIAEVLGATVAKYQLITQLMHSGVVQLDGDRARARWQVTELQVSKEEVRRFVVGRYDDEHVRTPGWMAVRAAHVRRPVPRRRRPQQRRDARLRTAVPDLG